MRIYKYIPSKYVDRLLKNGEMLFRALSYFRDYEDEEVRGDLYEGTRKYEREEGLEITKVKNGVRMNVPFRFESTVNQDHIFVFCLSTVFSEELASKFKTDICIEIKEYIKFISKVKSAVARRPSIKPNKLISKPVNYYKKSDGPGIDWALPEVLTISKSEYFAWQNEFRLAFCIKNAFDIKNTTQRLVKMGTEKRVHQAIYPKKTLKIGNISKICEVHKFV